MPDISRDPLTVRYLTTSVNSIEDSLSFLTTLLDPGGEPIYTNADLIELFRSEYRRKAADFIPVEAHAIYVGERSRTMEVIESTNMALIKSIRAGDLHQTRMNGQALHIGPNGASRRSSGIEEMIQQDQRDMRAMMQETFEWWYSRLLVGTVSYSQRGFEAFELNIGKPASHTIVVANLWSDTVNSTPVSDIQTAKAVGSGLPDNLPPTVAICGPDVAAHLLESEYFAKRLDNRNLDEAFSLSFLSGNRPHDFDGAVTYLGDLGGLPIWTYNRDIDIGGSVVPMIRPGYIEFINTTPRNGIKKYAAPIYDLKVNSGNPINTRYFSKSWETEYPSQRQMLVQSRQTVVPHRPGFCVSMQVL